MGNSVGRQETIGANPDERKDSRTSAAAMNQLSDTTIAGNTRHTINEPMNLDESSAAVIHRQGHAIRQPQLDFGLFGKCPDEGGPREKIVYSRLELTTIYFGTSGVYWAP